MCARGRAIDRGESLCRRVRSLPLRLETKAKRRTLGEDEAFAPLVVKVFFFFLIQILHPSRLSGLHFTSSPTLHRESRPSEDDGIHYHELLMLRCNSNQFRFFFFLESFLKFLLPQKKKNQRSDREAQMGLQWCESWADEFHYLLGVLETNRNVPVVRTAH